MQILIWTLVGYDTHRSPSKCQDRMYEITQHGHIIYLKYIEHDTILTISNTLMMSHHTFLSYSRVQLVQTVHNTMEGLSKKPSGKVEEHQERPGRGLHLFMPLFIGLHVGHVLSPILDGPAAVL